MPEQTQEGPTETAGHDSDVGLSPGKNELDAQNVSDEETMEQRIERLGRERPPAFATKWAEFGFGFSVIMCQILTEYFVAGFNVILPVITKDIHIPPAMSVWPATAFSLSIASTLLFFGRLGDQHGGYIVYLAGLCWMAVWSLIAGFSINPLMLTFCRAFQGVGAAAFLPTGVMLIGSVYRPGPRKNLVFALYGSAAVLGFFSGIFFAGVIGERTHWGWFFWIGAILSGMTIIATIAFIPNDRNDRLKQKIDMDWIGAGLMVSSLVLLVFSITQSTQTSHGWRTPYIPTLFGLSIILLVATTWYEGWVAKTPLLPADIFAVPAMTPLTIALLLLYGNLGIYLFYGTQYFFNVMGVAPLQMVAWFIPAAVGGVILAASEGLMLHIIPGKILLITSGLGALGCQLLLSFVPIGGSYWAWILPAMILSTIGIDLSVTLMMVFVTTQMPFKRQGLAGGLVNSVLQLGMAICIGLGDIVHTATKNAGTVQSLKNVFYFASALGGLSLLIITIWGNVPKATSDLTADEKAELAREAQRELSRANTHASRG